MNCNTDQKEIGGKQLLLKACVEAILGFTSTSANITLTAHGLKVGDIVGFKTVDTLTVVELGKFYYVKQIVDADTFTISKTPSSAALVANASEADIQAVLFKPVGGIRSKSVDESYEGIDITNEDSDEWKTLLDQAGIRSIAISGDGVYTNSEMFKTVQDNARLNKLQCLMIVDFKTLRLIEGCFKVTAIGRSGGHDGEASFSITAESSGTPTFFTLSAS